MRDFAVLILRLTRTLGLAGILCLGGFLYVSLLQPEAVILYTNDTYGALEPCG